MSTINLNWLANLSGARHRRRPAIDPERSPLLPRKPMTAERARQVRELVAAARREEMATDVHEPAHALQAEAVRFMLEQLELVCERRLAIAWNWVTVLAVMLGLTLLAFAALLWLCMVPH